MNSSKIKIIIFLIIGSLMSMGSRGCSTDEPEDLGPPYDPLIYVAEVPEQGPYLIPLDINGYHVWGDEAVYSVRAKLIYRLTFPREGGYATLQEIWNPSEVVSIINEHNYTQNELNTMMSRTEFPTSEIEIEPHMTFIAWHDPLADGGLGYFEWRKEDDSCCYRGNVIVGEKIGTYYIEFKPPESTMRQIYIIIDPQYPLWGKS